MGTTRAAANPREVLDTARATGTWTKDAIDALIKLNDKAVARALTRLYELQTEDERQAQATHHSNGMGFTACDAEIFSSFAAQVNKGHELTPRQLAICRKPNKQGYARLSKYFGQLVQLIAPKEAV